MITVNLCANMISKRLKKYFWDVDVNKLDPDRYPYFVIARLLEYGDKDAIRWMLKKFRKSVINRTLLKTRVMTPKSAEYWASVFGLSKNKILCLKRSYRETQKTHWPQ